MGDGKSSLLNCLTEGTRFIDAHSFESVTTEIDFKFLKWRGSESFEDAFFIDTQGFGDKNGDDTL